MQQSSSRTTLRTLAATVALSSAFLFAAPAQAAVVYAPGSIVDHGSYITDTVNHLDWYKFSNPVNTLGYSLESWAASNQLAGWSAASADQVRALETQFGWEGDTDVAGPGSNFGLTDAMSAYLGLTSTFYSDAGVATFSIEALTSDLYYFYNDATQADDLLKHQVTTSRSYRSGEPGDYFFWGDDVYAEHRFPNPGEADDWTGIWLARASTQGGGGAGVDCGRLAPCPPAVDVPAPSTGWLFMLALGVLALTRSRLYARLTGAARAT